VLSSVAVAVLQALARPLVAAVLVFVLRSF
jgi:hypothetical protein